MRITVATIIFYFVLWLLVDCYCAHALKKQVVKKRLSKNFCKVHIAASVILLIWLIITISLPRRSENGNILPIMWMLYTWLSVYAVKILYIIFSILGNIPRLFGFKSIRLGLFIGLPLGIIVFISMWWGSLVTRHQIEVVNVDITSSKIPESFNNYRIVQFSDAHLGSWGKDTTFISNLVDSINSLKPDLIVFTGDIVNKSTPEMTPFISILSKLSAKDGVISILGNHDYGDYVDWKSPEEKAANLEQLIKNQETMGWTLLKNEHVNIKRDNDSIAVIGVENWGEPPFKSIGDLNKALNTLSGGVRQDSISAYGDTYKILLTHNPEHWRMVVSKTSDIDLTMSGHTHAMQTIIKIGSWKWSPAIFRYKYWGGLYDLLGMDKGVQNLYVNIGCGEVGLPSRIGATPEITVFTLKSKK